MKDKPRTVYVRVSNEECPDVDRWKDTYFNETYKCEGGHMIPFHLWAMFQCEPQNMIK
jgi:hypothetical protein